MIHVSEPVFDDLSGIEVSFALTDFKILKMPRNKRNKTIFDRFR
jgi:hypothetical protein